MVSGTLWADCFAIACRATDDVAPAERRPCRERKAHPAADAPYAIDADLPKAQHPLPGNTCLHV